MDDQIDNVCEARDVVSFGVLLNPFIRQKLLQFLGHREIVTGVVRRDTEEFRLDIIFFENFENNVSKVLPCVLTFDGFECKEFLLKIEVLIDVMGCDSYTYY